MARERARGAHVRASGRPRAPGRPAAGHEPRSALARGRRPASRGGIPFAEVALDGVLVDGSGCAVVKPLVVRARHGMETIGFYGARGWGCSTSSGRGSSASGDSSARGSRRSGAPTASRSATRSSTPSRAW